MDDNELSRRKILSSMAIAGGAGALVGSSTVSLFSDEETFSNDSLEPSSATAGVIDLDVDIETDADGDKVTFTISLPNLSFGNNSDSFGNNADTQNNPAQIWVRTASCPDSALDAADTKVEVYLEECSNDLLAKGSIFDVFATGDGFRTGELLECPDEDDDCLSPGDERKLVIEITDRPSGIDPVTLELEFFAQQCRHNEDPTNPFDSSIQECGPPVGDEKGTPVGNEKALSFIAFCAKGSDASKPAPTITGVNLVDGNLDPISVDWETSQPVDYIVAKSGRILTMYDLRKEDKKDKKAGTVRTGKGDKTFRDPDSDKYPSNPDCPDKNSNAPEDKNKNNTPESCPCQAAVEVFESSDDKFDGKSTKLEDDEGELNP